MEKHPEAEEALNSEELKRYYELSKKSGLVKLNGTFGGETNLTIEEVNEKLKFYDKMAAYYDSAT